MVLHPVDRVAVGPLPGLVQDEEQRAGAVPPVLEVDQQVLPPHLVPSEHPGLPLPDPVVDAGEHFQGLVLFDESKATGRLDRPEELGPVAIDLDRARERRQPVAEPLVDRALRRPQTCQRLAGIAHVLELAPHDLGQPTAVTPAIGSSPPGIVSVMVKAAAAPTISPPS